MTQFKMPSLNTPLLLPVLLLLFLLVVCIICCYISKDNTLEGFDQNVDIETIQLIKKDLKLEEYKKYIGNEMALLSDIKNGVITEYELTEFIDAIEKLENSSYKKTTRPWRKQQGQENGSICYKPKDIIWGAANKPSVQDQIFYLDKDLWKIMPPSELSNALSKLISLYTTPEGKCKSLKSGQQITVNGVELLCKSDKLVIKIGGGATTGATSAATTGTSATGVAKSCKGWKCDYEGQVCKKGSPGAKNSDFVCKNEKWVAVKPAAAAAAVAAAVAATGAATGAGVAKSCKGWKCDNEGQICKKGSPGAKNGDFVCKNKKWVAVKPTTVEGFVNVPDIIKNKLVTIIRNDRNGYNCGNTSYEGDDKVNAYIISIIEYCNKLLDTREKIDIEPSTIIVENGISTSGKMSQQEKYKLNKLKENILQNQIDALEKEAPFKNTLTYKKNQLIETKKTTEKILHQITSAIGTINTLSSITFYVSNSLYDSIKVDNYNSTFYNDNLLIMITGESNVGVINKLDKAEIGKLISKISIDETSIFTEENKGAILDVLNEYKLGVIEKKEVDTKKNEEDTKKNDLIKKQASVLTNINITNIKLIGLQNIANALAVKDKTVKKDIHPIKHNETELRKYLRKHLAKNHSNKKDVTEYFNANIFK